MEIKHFDELFPVDQSFRFELAVIEQQIDLFWSQSNIKRSECFFEHKISDSSTFFFVNFAEDLFEGLGTWGYQISNIVDLNTTKNTNLLHWSSIFSFSS